MANNQPTPNLPGPELFVAALERLTPVIDGGLRKYAWPGASAPMRLREAMDYSLYAGGKRLRPALVVLACEACGGDPAASIPVAVAYEMVHTYSLIHDDLPAMDDDDLRRGRPSNHKVFGEATAILAGDAMLTYAFQLIASGVEDAEASRRLVLMLADAAGLEGMVAGQQDDLEAEQNPNLGLAHLESIHARKTGALIAAALGSGAVVAGGDDGLVGRCLEYGRKLGLAFQVADDILDVTSTAEQLGKSIGKDATAGKLTYPGLMGLAGAREQAERLAHEAAVLAMGLPHGEVLASLATYVVRRGS